MKLRFKDSTLLKNITAVFKDTITDGIFVINSSGISLQGMDSGHISMVGMVLGLENFESFECHKEIRLGISFASLMKICKCIKPKDTVVLSSSDYNPVVLNIELGSEERKCSIDMKLMNIDTDELIIPNIEFTHKCVMPSKLFKEYIGTMCEFGDDVLMGLCDKGTLSFKLDDDSANALFSVKVDSFEINSDYKTIQKFGLTFLKNYCNSDKISDKVHISMMHNTPLRLQYPISDNSFIVFYVAPKQIEGEENDETMDN